MTIARIGVLTTAQYGTYEQGHAINRVSVRNLAASLTKRQHAPLLLAFAHCLLLNKLFEQQVRHMDLSQNEGTPQKVLFPLGFQPQIGFLEESALQAMQPVLFKRISPHQAPPNFERSLSSG